MYQNIWTKRHSFISSLPALNRLSARDRRLAWGSGVDQSCLLCRNGVMSRDHLFSSYSYTKQLWQRVLLGSGVARPVGDWSEELCWAIQYLRGKFIQVVLLKTLGMRMYITYGEPAMGRCMGKMKALWMWPGMPLGVPRDVDWLGLRITDEEWLLIGNCSYFHIGMLACNGFWAYFADDGIGPLVWS